ncbi:peptidoglycan recognition family protein [Spongiactinospora sp. TRM90649]|uniref:N-acetylmuramoyl-L-alanine amidase n=1 Tax=Spongiactinospora sp. TRM90649 TaxID=3031114 RepID=UPI0023F9AC83|nr:peptidoglycan recognition family protein [Spongiactinospora sp. TRM90649]MDF5752226.1 peptidoglycan recognition family protein [Spongiactinospora sp. TRM90649]
MRRVFLAAAVALASCVAPPAAARPGEGERQAAYQRAARAQHVPESVLLAVSYLHSRWDTHGWRPSTAGGYGPMHLVDGAPAPGPGHGVADRRGDDSRGPLRVTVPRAAARPERPQDSPLRRAARLTGLPAERLRTQAEANILGGAALLAERQRRLGRPLSPDARAWYDAVASYATPDFADEVFATIRSGAARTTDDGHAVRLAPVAVPPRPRRTASAGQAECPSSLSCAWIPAAYRKTGKGSYGNHDRTRGGRAIDYIIIHDGETTYEAMTGLAGNPKYVSWHYTLRSRDGQVAQHVRTKDIAWHSGNWYFNTRSIGLEHEGYLARGGAWYTEAMYRSSARLVRYLADRYKIPLDREHILGHDNVPGISPELVSGMHEDPGPYWDWAHYFELLGAPLHRSGPGIGAASAPPPSPPASAYDGYDEPYSQEPGETYEERDPYDDLSSGGDLYSGDPLRGESRLATSEQAPDSVMILPSYDDHQPYFTGCDKKRPGVPCPARGAASVWLYTAPRPGAPLVTDIGKHPRGGSTRSVYDHAARASTGQRYAVAGRSGDWTAIWYLGQRAWFHNPASVPTAVPVKARTVTARHSSVPVYGRAYPGGAAYPRHVKRQPLIPLQYRLPAGQRYTVGMTVPATYLRASTFNPARHRLIRGALTYHQIQFGHRVMFVKAKDVRQSPA